MYTTSTLLVLSPQFFRDAQKVPGLRDAYGIRWPEELVALHAQLGAGPGGMTSRPLPLPLTGAGCRAAKDREAEEQGEGAGCPPVDAFWDDAEVSAVLGCGQLPAGLEVGIIGLPAGARAKVTAGRQMALREPPAPDAAARAVSQVLERRNKLFPLPPPVPGSDWGGLTPRRNPWPVSYLVSIVDLTPPAELAAADRLEAAQGLLRRGAAHYNATRYFEAREVYCKALALLDQWVPRRECNQGENRPIPPENNRQQSSPGSPGPTNSAPVLNATTPGNAAPMADAHEVASAGRRLVARCLLNLAASFSRLGGYEEAHAVCSQALDCGSECDQRVAHYRRAMAAVALGWVERAEEDARSLESISSPSTTGRPRVVLPLPLKQALAAARSKLLLARGTGPGG
mmetsp:Transcript_64616/g.173155  ORF Transcript_64616/g.173155 Transcript_64616/m.173155 type:complete len:400 (+) Transcript_64616:25-1224(+)